MEQTLTLREEGKKKDKKKEVISLKDSHHSLSAGWGQGPTPAVWNPYYGSWLLAAAQAPTARPEGRLGLL